MEKKEHNSARKSGKSLPMFGILELGGGGKGDVRQRRGGTDGRGLIILDRGRPSAAPRPEDRKAEE